MRTKSAFFIALNAVAMVALAAPAEARINKRQNNQQHRIAGGVSNGSLTARETYRLGQQQAGIARLEARSRADGNGLNLRERARIEHRQDRASRNIYRKKHN